MANKRGKLIDNTHLSIDQAERRGFIHRDYIAHCLRWSHVAKYLQAQQRYKTHSVLDIGCGKDLPLARLMYTSRLIPITGSYHGVDINKLSLPFDFGKFPVHLHGETDIISVHWATPFDTCVCFEMLEHIELQHAYRVLQHIREYVKGDTFISTPNYSQDVGAAGNHVNEMTITLMTFLLYLAGFDVVKTYGTFASIRDYEHLLTKSQTKLFNKLREYYDSNYLATIFAPLFPDQSRNVLYVVRPRHETSYDMDEYHMLGLRLFTTNVYKHSSSVCDEASRLRFISTIENIEPWRPGK